jgi:microsomal dipeptidase-like Zn-dependent dipeptidase
VVRAAREEGVRRMIISHAMFSPVEMALEEMKRCVEMGAFIEHVYVARLAGPQSHQEWMRSWRHISLEAYAEAIKALGAEHCLLSSDLGQYLNPTPADGLQEFVRGLAKQGITDEEIAWMVRKNPARLLGLEPFSA